MNIETMRKLYDTHERIGASFPGYTTEKTDKTVRTVDGSNRHGFVTYSDLRETDADAAIEAEIRRFGELGQDFEWKLYSHDQPASLKAKLEKRGFEIGEDEAIMALDLSELPDALKKPVSIDVRRVVDPDGLGDVAAIHRTVWPDSDADWVLGTLATYLRDDPEFASVYVAYVDGKPVSSAWINFPRRSPFASLWGGSTLAEFRKKGAYSALLSVRAREAIERGYKYLTIDASPMSRPIVTRHGFGLLSISNPCDWKFGRT